MSHPGKAASKRPVTCHFCQFRQKVKSYCQVTHAHQHRGKQICNVVPCLLSNQEYYAILFKEDGTVNIGRTNRSLRMGLMCFETAEGVR
jgi:hypothetical protein